MTDTLLAVRDLSITYFTRPGKPAVTEASFELRRGEILGILGESGAGKSSIGWAIMGMVGKPDCAVGRIEYNGENVLEMSEPDLRAYRWKEAAMVFQSAMNCLDPVVTVGHNITRLLIDRGKAKTKKEAEKYAEELLYSVNLEPRVMRMYPHELSGGMKQRVVIAIATALNPAILIADEPTTALDTLTQKKILELIENLVKTGKVGGVIYISHDISAVGYISDRLVIMFKGRIVEEGQTSDIIGHPLHPYTQLLLASASLKKAKAAPAPRVMGDGNRELIEGCPFTAYCVYSNTECSRSFPARMTEDGGHAVWCHLYSRSGGRAAA